MGWFQLLGSDAVKELHGKREGVQQSESPALAGGLPDSVEGHNARYQRNASL